MARVERGLSGVRRKVMTGLRSLALGAGVATLRFPIACGLVVVIAILVNLRIGTEWFDTFARFDRLMASLYAAAAAATAGQLFAESRPRSRAVCVSFSAVAAALIASAIWFAPQLSVFPTPLIVAATLLILLAPFVGRFDSRCFWSFGFWTVVGAFLAFLSVLVFVIGLGAIIEMIRFLFEVGPGQRFYEHVFATDFALVGPLFALGRIPQDFDDPVAVSANDRFLAGVRLLFGRVAIPLALVTALVLHAYIAKIILLGRVPANEIGWIVLSFLVFTLALRIACHPFAATGGAILRFFARWFAVLLVLPLATLFYAIFMRVSGEGFTIDRYFLFLAAVAAFGVVAVQAPRSSRNDIRLMAAIPIGFLFLSSFGPWGVAETVGRSQFDRLRPLVDRGPAGVEREAADRSVASSGRLAEARTRLAALADVDQLWRAAPLLDEAGRKRLNEALSNHPDEALGVVRASLGLDRIVTIPTLRSVDFSVPDLVDIAGYDWAIRNAALHAPRPATNSPGQSAAGSGSNSRGPIEAGLRNGDLVLRVGDVVDRFALPAVLSAGETALDASSGGRAAPLIVDLTSAGGRHAKAVVERVRIENEASGRDAAAGDGRTKARLTEMDAVIYVRSSEW